jgi:EAL domain-containing protein (putative c-di-GMP-specific phosphodiesterase class I)
LKGLDKIEFRRIYDILLSGQAAPRPRRRLVKDLTAALKRDRFLVLYQPELACGDGRLQGVESLVRLDGSRDRATIGDIVQEAEKTGEIDQLGEWVLRRACRDAAAWPNIFVAVNVSPLQFRGSGFAKAVFKAALLEGLPLGRLELEITETARFENIEQARLEFGELRAAGVKIALDDFGTGYSSLALLSRLPLDRLKIDKSFVDDLQSAPSAEIVRAIIALAGTLGLQVTAEGVETREQFEFLRDAGCDCVQGFLFSGPIAAADVAKYSTQPSGS